MEDRPEVSALAVAAAASGIDDMEIADQDLLLAIASPPTTGRTGYVKHLLTGQGIWKNDFKHCYAPEGGRMKAFSVELMVRDGTIVTGFNAASYCCFAPAVHQMKIEEVKVDGTIGKVLFPWNGCGTWHEHWSVGHDKIGGLKRRNCAPEHIPVSTTATRFKVSIRQNDKVGHNSYGGVAIFDAVGIPAPMPPRHGVAPAPTSPSATLRRPDADMVDLRCDAVDGATAYLWTKVGGDPAWSKCAKEPSCSAYLEEVGSFGLTVRPLFPMRTTLADGGEVEWYKNLKDGPKPWELDTVSTPGAKNASLGATVEGEFSVPTEVINVLQTAVVRFLRCFLLRCATCSHAGHLLSSRCHRCSTLRLPTPPWRSCWRVSRILIHVGANSSTCQSPREASS